MYIRWIINKDLVYITGNYTQYLVKTSNGKESESIYTRMHVQSVVSDFFDPMDCSPPGSSVHGILQARILEQVAISSSREYSWPRDWTWVSCVFRITDGFVTHWAIGKAIFLSPLQSCQHTVLKNEPLGLKGLQIWDWAFMTSCPGHSGIVYYQSW